MNNVRSTNYDAFAKLGLDKESARVQRDGEETSGTAVYKKMDDDVKALKERLRAAGVNRIVAGINADEESDYDSEDPEDDEKKAKPAAEKIDEPLHVPKLGKELPTPKVDRGGIPRPAANNNFMK